MPARCRWPLPDGNADCVSVQCAARRRLGRAPAAEHIGAGVPVPLTSHCAGTHPDGPLLPVNADIVRARDRSQVMADSGYSESVPATAGTPSTPEVRTRTAEFSSVTSVVNSASDLDLEGADQQRGGGWGGIRTHEALARLPVFKTGAFNRSATHPRRWRRASRYGLAGALPTMPRGAGGGVCVN